MIGGGFEKRIQEEVVMAMKVKCWRQDGVVVVVVIVLKWPT
jgi:hypothetical protein